MIQQVIHILKNYLKALSSLQIFFIISLGFGQGSSPDSLLNMRNHLQQTYDSLRSVILTDTAEANLNRAFQASNELISIDNHLINDQIKILYRSNDSLKRISNFNESTFKNQVQKIRNLYNTLILTVAVSFISLVLFLVAMILWYRRKNNIKKLTHQHLETDRLLAEYRKRMNELQGDLDNCRTQTKTTIHEKSLLEKEIIRLTEEVQKAQDAGLLSTDEQLSYPERIKILEKQLITESTRKKILEQEMLEILRKLRGDDES